MPNYDLSTTAKRRKLKVRTECYWAPIGPKKRLGYRRTKEDGNGIWRAWLRSDGGGQGTLGREHDMDYLQALKAAAKFFEQASGPEPSRVKLTDVLSAYLDHLHDHNPLSTYLTYKSRIDLHIRPQLGSILVAELTATQIEKWLKKLGGPAGEDEARKKRRATANRSRTILMTALMNHAPKTVRIARGAEWKSVKPLRHTLVGSRPGVFSEEEAQRLVNCCTGEFRHFVTFVLGTGCRPTEATHMRVRDLDLRTGVWSVRISKTGERVTYLTSQMVDLLFARCAGKEPGDLVFVRDDQVAWDRFNVQKPFKDAARRAKLDPEAAPYWLRHTYISLQLLKGARPFMVARNTGTSLRMLEQTYAQFLGRDMVKMLEAHETLYDRPQTNVVNF